MWLQYNDTQACKEMDSAMVNGKGYASLLFGDLEVVIDKLFDVHKEENQSFPFMMMNHLKMMT